MSSDHLTDLNKEQRRAVKHGIGSESATKAPPLLVIAGAGSGKTKTLAQQVDLPWSGTFHAIGARLLREYATQIGLKPSFTILDRSDAADLMDLVRHDLGQSRKASRFPKKDTCLSIYSFT